MTDLEKELTQALADMVQQNCEDRHYEDINMHEFHCFSGFIRCHKTAMELLVKIGIMIDRYPDAKQSDNPGRSYDAYFPPGWELKLWKES